MTACAMHVITCAVHVCECAYALTGPTLVGMERVTLFHEFVSHVPILFLSCVSQVLVRC